MWVPMWIHMGTNRAEALGKAIGALQENRVKGWSNCFVTFKFLSFKLKLSF